MSTEREKRKTALQAELLSIAAEERAEQQLKADKRAELLTANIYDLVDLVPEHSRTSCSDTNPCNGEHTAEDGGARCIRCLLLEQQTQIQAYQGKWDSRFDVQINLTFNPNLNP